MQLIKLQTYLDSLIGIHEVKNYLQEDRDENDLLIQTLILGAADVIRQKTNRQILRTDFRLIDTLKDDRIELVYPPIIEVTKVTINGEELSESDYEVLHSEHQTYLQIDDYGDEQEVEVEYSAGFTQSTLPAMLKIALLMLVRTHYDLRGSVTEQRITEIPHSINYILDGFRLGYL